MHAYYNDFLIRDWQPSDRQIANTLIHTVLAEYGLVSEPDGADWDVINVEDAYWAKGGEFWVVEHQGQLVGTAAYYPVPRGDRAVEIRKMYLLPAARGQGLGRYLLHALECQITERGFEQIWIETASVLREAVYLYENNDYVPATGVETARCDRIYTKVLKVTSTTE